MEPPDLVVMMFDLGPSGVVRNGLRIAGAAEQAGLRTEIWTVQEGGAMQVDVPPRVPVVPFGTSIGSGYSRHARKQASRQAAQALADALRRRQPRLALSAGNHFHELAATAAGEARPDWSGHLIGRVSNALPRFSWTPSKIPWSIWKRVAARHRLDAMDRLVTVSRSLERDLVRQLWISPSKVQTIPNGIDLDAARARAAEDLSCSFLSDSTVPVVVGAGRLVPQKDFAALVAAFADARTRMPMRLLLLGDGPERAALQGQAERLRIGDDLFLAGHVGNPLPFLAHAALFVLPSRWEGMSNALLEAMAVGCPVVASNCSGSAELLGQAFARQLVPAGDPSALGDAIVRTLRSPPDRLALQAQAARYGLDEMLAAYLAMFKEEIRR